MFLCVEPVDMRLGFDRLAQLARERVGRDPVDGGAVFVFGGRGASRLKILWFDRNGLCLLYKRFHRARFDLPAAASGQITLQIDGTALAELLTGSARDPGARKNKGSAARAA